MDRTGRDRDGSPFVWQALFLRQSLLETSSAHIVKPSVFAEVAKITHGIDEFVRPSTLASKDKALASKDKEAVEELLKPVFFQTSAKLEQCTTTMCSAPEVHKLDNLLFHLD